MVAFLLLGCGLRRAELAAVTIQALQQRKDDWVFPDLIGKGKHVRTATWIERAVRA